MIKALAVLAVALLSVAGIPHSRAHRTIDLDLPGNLEAVQRTNPDHFARIERILDEVPRRLTSEQAVATWMRAEFQARNVRYADLIMTSLPPKKRLEFSLDDTSYVKVVTLTGWRSKPTPAKKAPLEEHAGKAESAGPELLGDESAGEAQAK